MSPATLKQRGGVTIPRDQHLLVLLLSQYLFFLTRRPISESNWHYLVGRLAGLQSLTPALKRSGIAPLEEIASQLEHLQAPTFRRIGNSLQFALFPLVQLARRLPGDVVVEDSPPPDGWIRECRRVLLAFGPGIGIGDELIFASMPQRLKEANPRLEVATFSAYSGFWERVHGVDETLTYAAHAELFDALRKRAPYDRFDLVILADFEAPELYLGVAADLKLEKYLEISLGSRSAFLIDSGRRWVYRLHHVTPYFSNYYFALDHLTRCLRLSPPPGDSFSSIQAAKELPADRLEIFVTPFTSKYDPSNSYWSRLLTSVISREGFVPARFSIDTGKNSKTRRFAIELARSVAPLLPPGVEIRLAHDEGATTLSLPSVYRYLEESHAVLCADSFAAHAGPLFRCLTLVLARAGLEDWRVPAGRGYYFDPDGDANAVASAIRQLLIDEYQPPAAMEMEARFSVGEMRLTALAAELGHLLEAGVTVDAEIVCDRFREFAQLHQTLARQESPGDRAAHLLRQDRFAGDFRVPMPGEIDAAATGPLLQHLRDQWQQWSNTNFAKYLGTRTRTAQGTKETKHSGASALVNPPGRGPFAELLLKSLETLRREQLPTGEIATYFGTPGDGLGYRRSPLLSTFVHDVLACFDLGAPWVETELLDALPPASRAGFTRAIAASRSRIRRFLAWDEDNTGAWRFHGRASAEPPDADVTACAATVILQGPRRRPHPRAQRQIRALTGSSASLYQQDPIASVNALRFLVLMGEPADSLLDGVLARLQNGDGFSSECRYSHPLSFLFCVGRAWRSAHLPREKEVAERVTTQILSHWRNIPDFGGPLGAALGLNALADLNYSGPEMNACGQYLLRSALPRGGWTYAPFLRDGGGAPAWTTAAAMAALARSGVGR